MTATAEQPKTEKTILDFVTDEQRRIESEEIEMECERASTALCRWLESKIVTEEKAKSSF